MRLHCRRSLRFSRRGWLLAAAVSVAAVADPGLDAFVDGEFEKARNYWLQQAAREPDSPQLNYNLGLLYDEGLGVPADRDKAMMYYLNSAGYGYPPAMYSLGALFEERKQYQQAIKWWQQAAGAGLPEAQYSLGVLYLEGRGVEADPVLAGQWFKQAAKTAMENYRRLDSALERAESDEAREPEFSRRPADTLPGK